MIKKSLLAFVEVFFCVYTTFADVTNSPAVTIEQVQQFMNAWNTKNQYMSYPMPVDSVNIPVVLAALAKAPSLGLADYLDECFGRQAWEMLNLQGRNSEDTAAAIIPSMQQAVMTMASAETNAKSELRFDFEARMQNFQQHVDAYLVVAGPPYLTNAQAAAQRILAHLPSTNSWSYGISVYRADELLGHVALRMGNLPEARGYLRAAGLVHLSPDKSGPDHMFARELLAHGEAADKETVLAYLTDLINYYTIMAATQPLAKNVAQYNLQTLNPDKEAIQAGKTPKNLLWR